jgi:hypothetical protein
LLLRAYDIDTGKDFDRRKLTKGNRMKDESFGVPATARETVGESLDAEFCQRGGVIHANLVKKEELTDQPENKPFPSNKLVTY